VGLGTRDDVPFSAVLTSAGHRRSRAAAQMAADFVRGFYLADPATASSLALARLTRGLEEVGGDAVSRAVGGYAGVLAPLLRTLRARRADLRLSTVVEEIGWRRGRVEIRARGAAGGRLPPVAGDAAIVTLPVPMLRGDGVRFRPALAEKRRAAAALEMGPVVKVLLRFRRALWDETGPRALGFLHVPGAPVPVLWTLAPVRAPVLVGWAGGPHARRLAGRPPAAALLAALESAARGLGRATGELEAALDGGAVVDWGADPFAGGGYAVFPVGSDGAAEALARSVEGTLFFAGEATSAALAGTVEGAIQSGERAARDVNREVRR
jgi:monoamine oxidase